MKNILTILMLAISVCSGQNLVPNASFEDTLACPTTLGMPEDAIGWSSYRNTPDYANSCSNNPFLSVPHNWGGYQYAATGNAYMGIQCYFISGMNYREYFGRQLASPLAIGETYFVSFKVNCAFGGTSVANCGANKIGVRFFMLPFSFSDPVPVDNFADIYTDSIITDTLNWVTISRNFLADSAYQYLAIGNFFDDANTDTDQLTWAVCRAIYYVDDVCVSTNESGCIFSDGIAEHNSGTFPVIINSPGSNNLEIYSGYSRINSVRFFNMLGEEMYHTNTNASYKLSISLAEFPNGFYLFQIEEASQFYSGKICVIH